MAQPPVRHSAPYLKSQNDIFNKSFDGDYDVLLVEQVGFDGVNVQRPVAEALNTKIVEVGGITYIAQSAPGTLEATALWRAKKVDSSTPGTTLITWADGNANFDNIATDLSLLNYS